MTRPEINSHHGSKYPLTDKDQLGQTVSKAPLVSLSQLRPGGFRSLIEQTINEANVRTGLKDDSIIDSMFLFNFTRVTLDYFDAHMKQMLAYLFGKDLISYCFYIAEDRQLFLLEKMYFTQIGLVQFGYETKTNQNSNYLDSLRNLNYSEFELNAEEVKLPKYKNTKLNILTNLKYKTQTIIIASNELSQQMSILCIMMTVLQLVLHAECDGTSSQQKQQYLKDLSNLNEQIMSKAQSSLEQLQIQQIDKQQGIQQTLMFRQEDVSLAFDQFVEFSYPHLDDIVELSIKEAPLNSAQDKGQKSSSAQAHYSSKPQQYLKSTSCRVQDPELNVKKLLHFHQEMLSANGNYLSEQDPMNSYLVFLDDKGQYKVVMHQYDSIKIYLVRVRDSFADLKLIQELFISQIVDENTRNGHQPRIFAFQGKILILFNKSFYLLSQNGQTYSVKSEPYAKLEPNFSSDEEQYSLGYEKLHKLTPLKYGFVAQYQTYFDIYVQQSVGGQNQDEKRQVFRSIINKTALNKLFKNNSVIQVIVSEQLSRHSGYKIISLVENIGLIQLQYGAYTSINNWQVPYGDSYKGFSVRNDLVELIFSLGKNPINYVAQLILDRKVARKPNLLLNRFYDDIKDVRKVWIGDNQVALIGHSSVILYDSPINAYTMMRQNITQSPYHFSAFQVEQFTYLQRYTEGLQSILMSFDRNGISIIKLTKSNMSIQCQGHQSADLRIQIVRKCCNSGGCQDGQMDNLCRYFGDIRLLVQKESSSQLKSLKRYLIITLIVALSIALLILFGQIRKNTKVLMKLRSIKEKIKDKYADLELGQKKNKGDKIYANQRHELNEEDGQSKVVSEPSTNNAGLQ